MTTLTKIHEHNPMLSAISNIGDEQFTFCQDCENNIERWYNDTDPERLPMWTDWKVSNERLRRKNRIRKLLGKSSRRYSPRLSKNA